MEERSISDEILLDVLQDKLFSFIDVITSTQDETKIRSMLEKNFADKIISNIEKIKKSNL